MAEIRQSLADETRGDGTTARIDAWFAAQRERRALWVPVGLGLGVALYFTLPVEPPLWVGFALAGAAALAAWWLRGRAWAAVPIVLAVALLLIGLGVAAATWRTATLGGPLLADETRPVMLTGGVRGVEPWRTGHRLIIDLESASRLAPAETPRRVRINVRTTGDAAAPGDMVSVLAILRPLPEPVAPGGFDFGRHLFFQGIGAVGYAVGSVRIESAGGAHAGWRVAVERIRHRISDRIAAALHGDEGAVARALLTGQKGAIPEPLIEAMRGAGLAHLLAISGLHIGLVTAILFFVLRALLAGIEPLALRIPVKKVAAVCALAGAGAYLLITGMTVPTQRAFLMVSIVILAVLLDRTAISMRLVAWAALAILIARPESLQGVSFQLSFAAVVALVAGYEALRRPRLERDRYRAVWRTPAVYLAGVALTTVIAEVATAPYAAFHFNRVAAYGLAANMIAVPATAFVIMPAGVAALVLMLFGLESLALAVMGWGITLVTTVATTVAGWPGSMLHLRQMPDATLAAITLGGLWLCLWTSRRRWLGLAVIAAGLALWPLARAPDVLVNEDGRVFAVRDGQGQLALSGGRAGRFTRERWLERSGQTEPAPWADMPAHWSAGGLRCDSLGCLYKTRGKTVALITAPDAVAEDCAVADIVVSAVPVWNRCIGPSVVIDRFDLWRNGAHAVWIDETGATSRAVRPVRGDRPWVIAR